MDARPIDLGGAVWLGAALGIPPPEIAISKGLNDTIICPGLINSHDHLEFNCYPPTGKPPYGDFTQWSRDVQGERDLVARIEAIPYATRRQFGVLKNLLWGVTAVADHGGAAADDAIAVLAPYPVLHSPEFEPRATFRLLSGRAPVVTHVAEGTTDGSRRRALNLLRWNLWRRRIAGVHGVSLRTGDFGRLDALIWCPGSNDFLFGRTADVETAARETTVLFGTDATISAPGTLWEHLRNVRGRLPDRDILAALTTKAARFWGIPPSRLREDFFVARRRAADPWDAFFAITPADILMVVRQGRALLVDETLGSYLPGAETMTRIVCGGMRKHVAMPVDAMAATLAPQADAADIIARFSGAAGGCRAA